MATRKNCIATSPGVLLALLWIGQVAVAEPIGFVSDSTGPLLAKGANGSIKVLAIGSGVEPSDTLVSRAGAYARVTLTDHSDVALGPDTELAFEKYSFHQNATQPDEAELRLLKGRVRITSGVLGTRDTDTFTLTAGAATVNIRHSTFIAEYVRPTQGQLAHRDIASPSSHRLMVVASDPMTVASGPMVAAPAPTNTPAIATRRAASGFMYVQMRSFDAQAPTQLELSDTDAPLHTNSTASLRLAQNTIGNDNAGGLNPGLYVQVLDGMINVSNGGGAQNFTAGQFGFTPSFQQPPVILPANPGMQFTPPPSFSSNTGSQSASGSKPGDVDCQVR
jgi:FecR protein